MITGQELELAVLGTLIFFPNFLELDELKATDFSSPQNRCTFEIIAGLWEDSRCSEVSAAILAERLGGNGASAFVGGLMNADRRYTQPQFLQASRELRRLRKRRDVARRLHAELQTEAKTGIEDEAAWERILRDLDEIRDLKAQATGPALITLGDVAPREISWLWSGRIPFGMLSLLAGVPGSGKSFLMIFLAALRSRGKRPPDHSEDVAPASTLFLSAEDPVAQAIRPRADANGADTRRIFILEETEFDPKASIRRLKQAIEQRPDISLIVFDPLNSFLKSGTDYFRDPDVRRSLLRPLSDFAEETGRAVAGVVHLNKREDGGALSRIAGSVAYGAAARAVLGVARHPEDEDLHLVASVKSNYASRPKSLAFRINPDLSVRFEDLAEDLGAEEIFQRRDPAAVREGSFPREWLHEFLNDGPADLDSIRKAAAKASLNEQAIRRASKRLGVISKQSGFGQFKTSTWELPK